MVQASGSSLWPARKVLTNEPRSRWEEPSTHRRLNPFNLERRVRNHSWMAYDEALAERVRELVESEPGLSEKKMFGGLAFLIGGNMAVAASGQGGLLVRVDPAETDSAARRHSQARPFEMRGASDARLASGRYRAPRLSKPARRLGRAGHLVRALTASEKVGRTALLARVRDQRRASRTNQPQRHPQEHRRTMRARRFGAMPRPRMISSVTDRLRHLSWRLPVAGGNRSFRRSSVGLQGSTAKDATSSDSVGHTTR